jgi:glutathione S-transferase
MRYAVWGSELSPFALKLRASLRYAGIAHDNLPAEGSRWRNYRAIALIERAKRARTVVRYPKASDLDEYPLVPFLIEDGRRVYYDTSGLASWIDYQHPPAAGPLFPPDPSLRFCAQLIDEAFDELGLYLVHHNRWVVSALTNNAGERLAKELARVLPPGMQQAYGRRFARRQVRRLPYLFSVAPAGYAVDGLPPALTPLARDGFPPTHHLLDEMWERYVSAIDTVLCRQPYLLGNRFTVVDASVYGQLGMNLADPTAAQRLRQHSAVVFEWLQAIHRGEHAGSSGSVRLSDDLGSLLELICLTFVPLMQQNEEAYERARSGGETMFNEAAFDKGRSLYGGELLGRRFRSVVKTFQVRVWRDLKAAWSRLSPEERRRTSLNRPGQMEA